MTVTVITLTKDVNDPGLEATKNSVALQGDCANHVVIETPTLEDFKNAKLAALRRYDTFCYVDAGDTLTPGILSLINRLLPANAGVFCTDEREISDTAVKTSSKQRKYYEMALSSPSVLHQLVVMKRSSLPDNLDERLSTLPPYLIDWTIKVSAGLEGGVIHLPVIGYTWRRSPGSMSSSTALDFIRSKARVTRYLSTINPDRRGLIPTLQLKETLCQSLV